MNIVYLLLPSYFTSVKITKKPLLLCLAAVLLGLPTYPGYRSLATLLTSHVTIHISCSPRAVFARGMHCRP